MQIITLFSRLSFAVFIAGLAAALPSYAATSLTLYLVTSSGATVTISPSAKVTFGGTCTSSTCSSTPGFPVSAPRAIEWAGKLGNFSVSPAVGRIGTPPNSDVKITVLSGAAGTLTAYLNTTGIGGPGQSVYLNEATTVTAGSETSARFSAYVDKHNRSLQNGNPPGTLSATIHDDSCVPMQSCTGNATGPGPGSGSNPFSLTDVVSLTLSANSMATTDFMIQVPPPPASSCKASGPVSMLIQVPNRVMKK